jgi:hypothetical protein
MNRVSSLMLSNLQLKEEVAKIPSQIFYFVTMTVIMVACHISVHV